MTNHPNRSKAAKGLRDAAPALLAALENLTAIARCWEVNDGHKNIQLEHSEAYKEAVRAIFKASGRRPGRSMRPIYAVTHLDGDPLNNNLDNLMLVEVVRRGV